MKPLFILLGILFSGFVVAQDLNSKQPFPATSDYLMLKSNSDSLAGNFIFKNKQVFYGCNRQTQIVENPYKASAKRVKELFDYAEKINLSTIKSADVSKINPDNLRKIEYRKSGVVYTIYWDTSATDSVSQSLNELVDRMNSFW